MKDSFKWSLILISDQGCEKIGMIMDLRRVLLAGFLIVAPLSGQAKPVTPPPAGTGAAAVVQFVVNYEEHASDTTALLRGKSDKPTKLETQLFTNDFLTAWYALKAKEAADPDGTSVPNSTPGTDNVTNGDTDYIINDGPEGEAPKAIKYKDLSDKLNGAMVSLAYSTNGTYSTLFFLKQEDGQFKIDDISLEPFSNNNFDPKTLHHPGTSEGVRKDIAEALNNFAASKK